VSSCRTIRRRFATKAERTANSFCRAVPRASSRMENSRTQWPATPPLHPTADTTSFRLEGPSLFVPTSVLVFDWFGLKSIRG
jgi:hypothetical protein